MAWVRRIAERAVEKAGNRSVLAGLVFGAILGGAIARQQQQQRRHRKIPFQTIPPPPPCLKTQLSTPIAEGDCIASRRRHVAERGR